MAKFSGKIGWVDSKEQIIPADEEEEIEEIKTGIWLDEVTEVDYSGDVIRESKQWSSGEKVNDDLTISNRLSIIADNFAYENFSTMRYVIWNGIYWKVSSVEILRPRLILTLGGVYNGPTYTAPEIIE